MVWVGTRCVTRDTKDGRNMLVVRLTMFCSRRSRESSSRRRETSKEPGDSVQIVSPVLMGAQGICARMSGARLIILVRMVTQKIGTKTCHVLQSIRNLFACFQYTSVRL